MTKNRELKTIKRKEMKTTK